MPSRFALCSRNPATHPLGKDVVNPRDETPNPDTPASACISCIRCGYDLSGFAPADACPECGLAEASTASTLLFRAAGRETARSLADTIGSTRAAIFWSGVFASAGLISLLLLSFFAFGLVLCGVLARIISLAGWRKVLAPSPCFGQPWFEKPRRAAARVVVAECIAWFILGVLILGSFLTMHTDFQPLAIAIPIAALARSRCISSAWASACSPYGPWRYNSRIANSLGASPVLRTAPSASRFCWRWPRSPP